MNLGMYTYKKLIIEKFNLNLDLEKNSGLNRIGYFELNTTEDELNEIKKCVDQDRPIVSDLDYNVTKHPLAWTTYLSKNSIYDSRILPDIKVYSFDTTKRLTLNKGHLIASDFQKYLVTDKEKNKFFFKNNIRNIIPQFSNINSSTDGYMGQLSFERKVESYLNKNENVFL